MNIAVAGQKMHKTGNISKFDNNEYTSKTQSEEFLVMQKIKYLPYITDQKSI